ncbi:MAG: tetratricopeptide repeat protein [Elusimicrobiota bacterium]
MATDSLDSETVLAADDGLPASVRGMIQRGRERRLRLDTAAFEDAVPLLREAIEIAPAAAAAYAELSETYSSWGALREASCLGFWRELRVLEFQSLYDLAYAYAEMALRLDPGLPAAHRATAAALRRGAKADPDRRSQEAMVAVELDPENPEGLADRWRVLGYDPDDAVIRRIVETSPELTAAQLDLAAALSERGRYAEALTVLERALRLHPSSMLVYHDTALLLDRKGLRANALEVLGKGRLLRPADPLILQGFALLGETL